MLAWVVVGISLADWFSSSVYHSCGTLHSAGEIPLALEYSCCGCKVGSISFVSCDIDGR